MDGTVSGTLSWFEVRQGEGNGLIQETLINM